MTHTNTSFANESFSFDVNGNRTMSGYSTATGNRLSSDGANNYTYDDEGNLIDKTVISSGNKTLYTWDHRNRLAAVDSKVGGTTTRIATYTYDALDRRVKVVANGATRYTLYDGPSAVLDFDNAGAVTARYLQGPVIDEILARETSSGVAWYLPDRLGTIRDLSDNSGAIVDHIDYGVFGAVIAESAPSVGDRWKYTGRELDGETGLYQYRSRYYDAATGRFVSGDRIGFAGGDANLYRYVMNRPSLSTDSEGLYVDDVPEMGDNRRKGKFPRRWKVGNDAYKQFLGTEEFRRESISNRPSIKNDQSGDKNAKDWEGEKKRPEQNNIRNDKSRRRRLDDNLGDACEMKARPRPRTTLSVPAGPGWFDWFWHRSPRTGQYLPGFGWVESGDIVTDE